MLNSKPNFKNCRTSIKIVIVGNSGTGKTSFCNRWMKDKFTDDYKATVLNVKHGVNIIQNAFHDHPDIEDGELDVLGAVYDIETGVVEWV